MADLGIWHLVGAALVLWVGYDLVVGYSYSYRLVLRSAEPVHYWVTMAVWAVVAALTLIFA